MFPEGASAAGQTTKAEAMRQMLENWNAGLQALAPHITEPDEPANLRPYGTKLQDTDLAPIPDATCPGPAHVNSCAPPSRLSTRSFCGSSASGSVTSSRIPSCRHQSRLHLYCSSSKRASRPLEGREGLRVRRTPSRKGAQEQA